MEMIEWSFVFVIQLPKNSLQKVWEMLKKEPVCDTLIELY